ncbi:MAG: DUF2384 domain-containing protein [Flavobacteriales bacterium]|nr:DUF2384 domain-containing protein [Flavobacteriales bacterium]
MGKTATLKKRAVAKKTTVSKTVRKTAVSGKYSTKALHGISQLLASKTFRGSHLTITKFKGIAKDYDIDMGIWSGSLHMSTATLTKRIEKKTAFDPLETDRLLAVEQVLKRGMEVFEDADDLEDWLKEKHALLGNERPKDLLRSTWGIGLVMMELGRIEHGVY